MQVPDIEEWVKEWLTTNGTCEVYKDSFGIFTITWISNHWAGHAIIRACGYTEKEAMENALIDISESLYDTCLWISKTKQRG